MITESRKDGAAKINGLEKERYEDKVRAAVGEVMFPEDELAIHRKAIAYLFEIVATLHPDKVRHEEFEVYNALIESIKEKQKNV